MLIGAHMANGPIAAEDLRLFTLGGFTAAKLFWYHSSFDVIHLRDVGADTIMVRLPNSRRDDGKYPSASDYAALCAAHISEFYRLGVHDFQVDCEPQFQWDNAEYGPWQYQWFIKRVARELRTMIPLDVHLISPPLSYSPGLWELGPQNPTTWRLDDWLAAYSWTDGGRDRTVFSFFDEVGAHPYWQSAHQMIDPSYGGLFTALHARSGGMPVVLCEWAASCHLVTPSPSEGEVEAVRASQYPLYLKWLATFDYVEASYVYILGGSPDWQGFRLTERVCQAIGGRRKAGSGGGVRGAS